jgi:hypothetical protein
MTVWSFYTFEARLVPRADRVAVLAGQAGAKDMAVRPYLPLPPGGPAPWAVRQRCLQFRMLIVGFARLSQITGKYSVITWSSGTFAQLSRRV